MFVPKIDLQTVWETYGAELATNTPKHFRMGPFLFGQPFSGSEKGRLESEPWSCKKMQVINHQDYVQTQHKI